MPLHKGFQDRFSTEVTNMAISLGFELNLEVGVEADYIDEHTDLAYNGDVVLFEPVDGLSGGNIVSDVHTLKDDMEGVYDDYCAIKGMKRDSMRFRAIIKSVDLSNGGIGRGDKTSYSTHPDNYGRVQLSDYQRVVGFFVAKKLTPNHLSLIMSNLNKHTAARLYYVSIKNSDGEFLDVDQVGYDRNIMNEAALRLMASHKQLVA